MTIAADPSTRSITTARGITCDVVAFGADDAPPLVAFHGLAGHLGGEPSLAALGDAFRVYAPVWPGFGPDGGEEQLEDMLDFALHGADVVAALGLAEARPHLYGHSFGGMVAAEMVALAPQAYGRVGLVAPAGLWLDEHPIADIYAMLPFDFPGCLFHDPEGAASLLTGGVRFDDHDALVAFLIANARRLGTAGKVLFPIPDRRLIKRLYRVANPVLLVWGATDRLIPPAYAAAWTRLLPSASTAIIEHAAHMAPYEQPAEVAAALTAFYRG